MRRTSLTDKLYNLVGGRHTDEYQQLWDILEEVEALYEQGGFIPVAFGASNSFRRLEGLIRSARL